MPTYVYLNPETEETVQVIQTMKEEHKYIDDKGLEWKRVWNTVQASENTQLDPFSEADYVNKIGSSKGSLGDCWERSGELSQKRADQNGGVDPVKAKYYEQYSKKRKGAVHQQQAAEFLRNARIEI